MSWREHVQDPRRQNAVRVRMNVEAAIREFFAARDFLETRTPLLVPCPGMETDIRPFEVKSWAEGLERAPLFLPTSPEFAMKKLLSGGLTRIFQICSAFRDEPRSTTHAPEFTMLEWYRTGASYEDIMRDTEELVAHVAARVHGRPVVSFQGREISVATPWPRFRTRDLFQDKLGIDLVALSTRDQLAAACEARGLKTSGDDTWNDVYFRLWLNLIEPELPADRAAFITRYPASQAALAVVDQDADGSRWARRFEAYAGGVELANAFEELTDPVEQRARFVRDMEARTKAYGPSFPKTPIDEDFLRALEEGLPPCSGIALGVDRLVMLMADEPDVSFTFWL